MRRLALVLALIGVAAAPAAAQIPGATYTGTHNAGNGHVLFKVSGDGSRVVAYSFRDVDGNRCTYVAGGDEGVWEGAPLTGGAVRVVVAAVTKPAMTCAAVSSKRLRG